MKNKSFKAILWINQIPWCKLHICLIANLYVTLLSVTILKLLKQTRVCVNLYCFIIYIFSVMVFFSSLVPVLISLG